MSKNPFLKNKNAWFKKSSFQDAINQKQEDEKTTNIPVVTDTEKTEEWIKLDLAEVKNATSLDLIFNDLLFKFIDNFNKNKLKSLLLKNDLNTDYEIKIKTIIDPSTFKLTKDNDGIIQDNKKVFHVKGGVITLESTTNPKDKKLIIIYDYMTSLDDLDKKQYQKITFLRTAFKNLPLFPVVYFVTDIKDNDLIIFNDNCKLNMFYHKNIVVNNISYQPASIFLQDWFDEKKLNIIFQKTLKNAILTLAK